MSILLLIRCEDDMRPAIAASNEFLANLRKQFRDNQKENRIVGVWLRNNLDTGLPGLGRCDLECCRIGPVEGRSFESYFAISRNQDQTSYRAIALPINSVVCRRH